MKLGLHSWLLGNTFFTYMHLCRNVSVWIHSFSNCRCDVFTQPFFNQVKSVFTFFWVNWAYLNWLIEKCGIFRKTDVCIWRKSTGGTLLPHQSYGTYPFGQPPQIIPAVSPLTPRPSPFGYPPIFYWPYPSPPVSPTNYYGAANGSAAAAAAAAAAVSAAVGGANNGSGLPGTLVIMRGLPFTASCSDILQFFSGFSEVRGLSSDKLFSFFLSTFHYF